jgi:hypothetical protein
VGACDDTGEARERDENWYESSKVEDKMRKLQASGFGGTRGERPVP